MRNFETPCSCII